MFMVNIYSLVVVGLGLVLSLAWGLWLILGVGLNFTIFTFKKRKNYDDKNDKVYILFNAKKDRKLHHQWKR